MKNSLVFPHFQSRIEFQFQTGSGKTYTITGSPKNYNDRGIIPRSIQYIFAHNEKVSELESPLQYYCIDLLLKLALKNINKYTKRRKLH